MKYFFLCLILSLTFIANLFASTPRLQFKRFQSANVDRNWWEHVPVTCAQQICPLVMAFHDEESTGDRFDDNIKMVELSDRHKFILIYPNALRKGWNDGRAEVAAGIDDVGFVQRLLEDLKNRYKIDSKRIFATGLSNGGLFVFRLACEKADIFSAVAPVAAHLGRIFSTQCNPSRPVSIINIVGTDDKISPMEGGEIKGAFRLKNLGQIFSSNETINFWITKNKCNPKANIDKVRDDDKKDETHALLEKYESCAEGAEIYRWVIGDGGHTWPSGYPKSRLNGKTSREINASEEIWDFFAKHPMNDNQSAPPALPLNNPVPPNPQPVQQ